MSAAHEVTRTGAAPAAEARPPGRPERADRSALARRVAARLAGEWLPRAAWAVHRTGRPGLAGLALLAAAAIFLSTTHREVAAEVAALRTELAAARRPGRAAAPGDAAVHRGGPRALPARTEMPTILRQLFGEATRARLAVDTGRYEIKETSHNGVVRYRIAFPVTGPYPQIRAFLDATLAKMPVVALNELTLERRAIGDAEVQAQIRLTVFTAAAAATAAPAAPAAPGPAAGAAVVASWQEPAGARGPLPASDRVVPPVYAAALFAQRSWVVPPKQPKLPPLMVVELPPPPPPPSPVAPAFPYAFLGSFAPEGDPPIYFFARNDRVYYARVGDQLEGVYQLESAAGAQLVFVYLPLDTRQTLAIGGSP